MLRRTVPFNTFWTSADVMPLMIPIFKPSSKRLFIDDTLTLLQLPSHNLLSSSDVSVKFCSFIVKPEVPEHCWLPKCWWLVPGSVCPVSGFTCCSRYQPLSTRHWTWSCHTTQTSVSVPYIMCHPLLLFNNLCWSCFLCSVILDHTWVDSQSQLLVRVRNFDLLYIESHSTDFDEAWNSRVTWAPKNALIHNVILRSEDHVDDLVVYPFATGQTVSLTSFYASTYLLGISLIWLSV